MKDDGGTANSGADTDPVANVMTIDVTSVNDAPDGADNTVTTLEDTPYTFATGDFGFSDPNDNPDNNLLNVIIDTLPAAGTLTLNGVAVTAGQVVSAADIASNLLVFTPAADANGASYADFDFRVQDDGGTANGGADTDVAANTMTIDVTPVNDAPAGADNTVTTDEDTAYTFAAGDFGFTDPVDGGAHSLQSVIITTLPANGTLLLSGVAVTAGQEIAAAQIGNLTFTPDLNDNGAGYADFTFQVRDDGGTADGGIDLDATPNTMTIDVTPVNDEPSGADNTLSILEDGTHTFAAADFGFTDVVEGDALYSVIITTLPVNGVLELSGVAVTAGQEILVADIPNLTFEPAADANGNGYADFTFQVRDDGGTPNGGQDIDQSPNTITFDVTPVNDAPDGTDNTVTTLEDTAYIFAAADFGFTDPIDGTDSLQSVVITTLPADGVLELSGVAVTAGQEITAAQISNLTFTPASNENGAGYTSFTFQVRDDGGTANGGIDLDPVANTMTIDVTSVNDAPSGADITLTTLEDTGYTFAAADFGFTDPDDSPANNFANVIITALPANGALTLNGAAVTLNQVVSVADINGGLLAFTPAANENGAGYDSFTFRVQDDGGTTDGGVDTDQSDNTVSFDVTSVDDEPAGADNTVTTLEDTAYTFATSDFGFTDTADSPANALDNVIITTIPSNGTLTLNGVAVTAGQSVSAADIASNLLVFTPAADANGAGYDAFTFQVQDDGTTANGGVNTDQTPNTMTIDVTPVNDAPDGADITLTTLEDTAYTFAAADFGFTDPIDGTDSLQSVIINTLPASGVLELSGVAVTAGQEIAAADIPNLTFTPVANENGASYASFNFQVRDDGGTANGGIDLDPTQNTVTFDVTSVNDAPSGADNTVTTLEDTPYTFAVGDFGFTDADDSPANNFTNVVISTLPSNGTLTLNGVAVTAGQTVSVADINSNLLVFTPAADDNGAGYDNFTFQVQDDDGTADGGQDTDQSANTMTIDVTSVNDAPDGTDNTVLTDENVPLTFAAADFGFTDPNDNPDNNLQAVIITTLPADGVLELSGVAVTAGQVIAVADIPNLTFTPALNENGPAYASFTFQVQDDDGTANGGVDTDPVANTMTIDVRSVNNAPVGTDATLTTLEDTPYTFSDADFGFTDPDDTPANNFLNVIITTLPTAGTLELSGVAVTAGQVIAVADIPNLVFTPVADENGAGYATFTFQVQDDDGTNFGGQDTDQSPNTITFDVTSVNDEPDGTDNTVTTNEDTPYTFAAGDFGFTDPNDNPDNNLLNVIVTTIPTNGTLTLNGVAVTAGQVVSVADINSNLLVFTPALNDNGAGYDSFTFQVQDDDGTANGGQDTDQSANTMTIDVTAIDDPPVLNTNAGMNTFEGFTETLTTAMLSSSDVDTAASDIVYTVTSNVANGQLELTTNAGVAITSFTQDDLDNNRVVYVHDSSETTTDSFDFEISDATTNIGSATFNISITPVNDEPIGADNTVTTLEDAPYTFSTADFGFTDPNDTPSNNLQNVIITTIPSNGTLTLNGVAVTAGQAVSAADIASNLLVFTPVANANGAGYDSFTFQVQDDGGTANTGVDTDQSANTMTIDVTSVNDAPDGADITLTTLEDTTLTFTAADFGFSDVNDSPANALQSIIFTTVPATGSLQLSGVAVTAGQEIAVADIPNLTYDPVADENGAAYTSFTFQVRDDGGTSDGGVNLDPVANTVTIDVTSVNDEPAGADNTVTTLEDTDYTFTAAEFGFTDPNDLPANSLAGIVITTVPASGSLSLAAGASAPGAVTAGQVVSAADIAFLTYSPALNDNGLAADSFTFQVQDDDGTANGGQDTDQSANTMTIDITSVNDAPDGADDTILILESSTYTFAAADFGFTDAAELAANNLYSVIIDTLPANGALELSGVAVTAGQEILVADIPNLTFAPVTDENGVGYASIDFRVRDDGGTANGGVDTDVAANTITFDVDPINSAPIGADNTITILEDSVLTFAAADFGFTDPNDIPSNSLQGVIINTLPADGVLELSGVAVTAGQTIAVADIPNLTFTPANHEYGAGYASFDFQVQDDGGVANGGVDIDPTPNTITIDVTEVNDEPAGADITLTTLEDTTLTFTAANFGFTDVNDSPSDNLQSIIITTLPADGVLQLSGVNVTAGQEIAVADIPNLTFDPATDENGAGYTSFTFQVRDDGGTADGGVDTDQSPNVVTIDVTSVNDAPDGTDNTVTTLEDTDYVFTTADFGFTDPNDDPDNNLLNVIIDTLPVSGTLTLAAGASAPGAVTAGQVISAADIAFLTFTPVADENGAAYASFDFRVQDDDGTANGGADTDPVANTMTIDVTSVNDEPAGADITLTTLEDTAYTFAAGDFGFTDPNDSPANNFANVIINTLPADGVLELSGAAVTAGQVIAVADIPNLTFTPGLNDNGAAYTSFTFSVQDDDGTANGGQDTDQTPNTVTFDVTSVNDAPDGADNTVTTLEDTPYTFTSADFGYTDAADSPANNFTNVIISALPTNGTLTLNGVAVTAGQTVSVADIDSNLLVFTPALNANGTAYDTFDFQVQDDGGTADGGVDIDPVANTMTIDVTSVNDAPDGADITLTTLEDTPYSFAAADFGFTDAADSPANALLNVIIDTLPASGTLELSGVAVTAGQVIAVADIPNLVFTPAANENGASYANFDFRVQDDGGTADGGVDTDVAANTVTFDVTSVNDAPEGADITLTTLEDTDYTFSAADFGFTDPNDSPANNFTNVIITTIPSVGTLELSGVAVTAGQVIAVGDIPNLVYVPATDVNGLAADSFTFQVQDDDGTANGGEDTDQSANVVTFDITSVNDAPDGADNTLQTFENTDLTFTAADFGFTDPNDDPDNNLQAVIISTLPVDGTLTLAAGASAPGAVTAGQAIAVADIPFLRFTPALNENGPAYASFDFQVQDDDGTANGGQDTDQVANTITIDVISVNNEPIGADITLTTLEDTAYTFAAADFGFTDPDDTPSNAFLNVIITTLPASGVLQLSGVDVTAGQVIAVGDIPNLTFMPDTDENGAGYTSFTFQVQDDGGTLWGGVDIDQSPNTVTFDVTSVNDEPDGTDNTVTAIEDTDFVFTAADFGFTDPNDDPDNNLLNVIITTLPTSGTLSLAAGASAPGAVVAGQVVSAADIAFLTYSPALNDNGLAADSFTFQVQDDDGVANGGQDTDQTANLMTIDITSVNDAPDGTDATLTTLEDTPYTFAGADFGLTDASDSPANALLNVIIDTLPVDGVLELSGVAVTAGQVIAAADIPNLTFTPALHENGAAYASFDFRVQDDGGTTDGGVDIDPVANTITFDVTSVNDAPEGADITLTTLEDTDYTFSAADFGYTDPNDSPANNFDNVIITTVPAVGSLELSGVTVTAGQVIAVVDIPNLVYVPATDVNGLAADSFTFQVQDDGGTADGGEDTDQSANTVTFDITSVNDAPDGTDNTVSTLEGSPYTFAAADFGFTDPNDTTVPNALQSVVITTITSVGTLELSGVAVVAGQEIALADIPNLTFTPVANGNGNAYDAFTFQVRDDGGTADGGVDLDPVANNMVIDVIPINSAPYGADITLTTLEDTAYTFSDADFGFSDPDDTPSNALQAVIITSLPASGILELSGVAVTAGQTIAVADIPNLTFTPDTDENGAGYTSFTFQVQDDGGTDNGGVDIDQSANTVTFDVTSVNDEPEGTDNTVTTLEDTDYTFTAAEFGFTDPNDNPDNNLLNVIITTLPASGGTLTLAAGASAPGPVVAGQVISAADLDFLVYSPPLDVNGLAADSFTFQVQDDDGVANGGQDTDQTPNTMTVDITSVNDAPEGTDNTVTTLEDTDYVFTTTDFGFTDPKDNPDNNLLNVIIDTLPASGTLTLAAGASAPGAVVAGQVISAADVAFLTFTPVANENGAAYASFGFRVQDDDGVANGGADTDPIANTMTIDVTSVNDEPAGADITLSTLEDTPYTFSDADFGFTDPNDSPANNFANVIITALPTNGILELSGVAVTAGQVIAVGDIPNLTFTPAANEHGVGYDTFTFQVQDDDGTANGGQDTDQTPNVVTFDVVSVNDEPTGADNTVTTLEDTDYVFTTADFGFDDPNDTPNNNLLNVIITTLPTNGTLFLDVGASAPGAVVAGQAISAADVAFLTFTPLPDENGAGYDSFTFQVQDDDGVANGGQDTDQTPNLMTIDVTSVNDAPAGTDATLTTLEDTPYTFAAADFGFTDPNDDPDNNLLNVIIDTLPLDGVLELSGVAVTAGQVIAAADIPNLVFTPAANENGAAYASFDFRVQDDDGTANGGADTDPTANTITFDVTSVNDEPAGADNTVTTLEDTDYVFTAAEFGFTDPFDSPANNLLNVIITTLPAGGGTLTLGAGASAPGPVVAGQAISAADLAFLTFTPSLNANGAGADSFTFQVQDDDGVANGGQDTDQTPNVMTVDVISVNDAPDGTDITISTLEDTAYTFSPAIFGFTDAADSPANNFIEVTIDTLPASGTLTLSGVPVTAGQVITVGDLTNLVFTPVADENGAGYASFDFTVRDDGGTANGGVDTDPVPNTVTIDVISVNDEPFGADNTVNTLEDTDYVFTVADFGFTDPNDNPANNLLNIRIDTIPAGGVLTLAAGASAAGPVTAGQVISAADIAFLTYTPPANEHGNAYDTFTFSVQDDGGTLFGGVDYDQTPNTMTIDITSVNDAPDGTDITLSTLEDTAYTFAAADFGFTDVNDDNPVNNFQNVIITTLPASGILELSGVAVTAGQVIAVGDITNLTFTPDLDEYGAGYTDFTFQVQDDGGTANTGVDIDPTPNTVTFDVVAVNDAPDGADITLTTREDEPLTFTAADFGFSDANDNPDPHNLQSVIITTVPAIGTFELAAGASAPGIVTAGQVISAADIPFLTFTPVANEHGAGYADFTFQVVDDGGTANGGVDTDPVPNTVTIDVTSVNDAPLGADNSATILEDNDYVFNVADFGFTDPSDSPANNFANVIITALPARGTLTLAAGASAAGPVTAGQVISVADIPFLTYSPVANEHGANYADIFFQVQDDGGTANTGVDTDPVANVFRFHVTSVNDEPLGTDNTVTTLEDTPFTFTAANFGFTDPQDDNPANNLLNVIIDTLPVSGTLTLAAGASAPGPVVSGQVISAADLSYLVFTPVANEHGTGYADFTFRVQDDGGTANGGIDTDQIANTMTVDVISVNDAPLGADNSTTILEDFDYVFNVADFGFTDPSDSPANNFANVIIDTLPADGTLFLAAGASAAGPVTAGQVISVADIPFLTFSPVANEHGANYADFTFRVQDDGGTLFGGADTDPVANTFTFHVTSVNDEPLGADNTVTTLEDTEFVFSAADFGFTDPQDDNPANNLANVIIDTIPTDGTLYLDVGSSAPGVVTAGQVISAADLAFLTFSPAANEHGTGYADFTFRVQDDGGTANGGIDTDQIANTMTIDVTSVNDAPAGADNTVSTLEDTDYIFSVADFGFTDPNDNPDNNFQNVIITTLPASGTLTLAAGASAAGPVTAGQVISVADIPFLTFTPTANEHGAGYADFTFQVQDDDGTANGGQDTDQTPNTMTIDVVQVNDAPVSADNTITTNEDTPYVFNGTEFVFTDPIDGATGTLDNFQAVRIVTLPPRGTLTLAAGSSAPGAVSAGQYIAVADLPFLTYTPNADGNGAGYGTFTFQVQDDGGTANGGVDLSAVQTLNVDVTPVDDLPVLTTNTGMSVFESHVTTITSAMLHAYDVDTDADFDPVAPYDPSLLLYTITAIPVNGDILVNGVALGVNGTFTQDDINNGRVEYAHDGSNTLTDGFVFEVTEDGVPGVLAPGTPGIFNIAITLINDAPYSADNAVVTLEDTPFDFNTTYFAFSDPDDATGASTPHNWQAVRIVDVPTGGHLELTAGASAPGIVTAGQYISVPDLNFLRYVPALNGNGVDYGTFTFQVQDDGGTANGGVDLSAVHTMKIDVTPVNDAPHDLTLTPPWFIEGMPVGWSIGTLTSADVDSSVFTYSIVGAPEIFAVSGNNLVVTKSTIFGVDPEFYTITLRTSDGFLTYDEVVTIRMYESPAIISNGGTGDIGDIGNDAAKNLGNKGGYGFGFGKGGLPMYVMDTINEIRDSAVFNYGDQGLMDSSLSTSDKPLRDVFYGLEGLDQVLKVNAIEKIQRLIEDIKTRTGYEITPDLLKQLVEQAILERDIIAAGTDITHGHVEQQDSIRIYENNRIYKALLDLNAGDQGDDTEDESIFDKKKDDNAQYLHAQLDEAAQRYLSKHSRIMEALRNSDQ